MATSREERMASRLRGAGRRIEEDISFGFVLPEVETSVIADPPAGPSADPSVLPVPPPTSPAPAAAPPRSANPNTSAKRRRISPKDATLPRIAAGAPVAPLAPPPLPLPATLSGRGRPSPYDALNDSPQSTRSRASPRSTRSGPAIDALRRSVASRTPRQLEDDDMESLPRVTPRTGQVRVSTATREEEIVQESPADAPGSGRRRRIVRVSQVAGGAGALLQQVMQSVTETRQGREAVTKEKEAVREEVEEDEITAETDVDLGTASSPLARKMAQRGSGREGHVPRGKVNDDEITAEVKDVNGAQVGSSPLAKKVPRRNAEKRGNKTAERNSATSAEARRKNTVEAQREKTASRKSARRSGVAAGAAGFGLEDVDELSPAQGPATSSSALGRRTIRLSGASADDTVDELSPAAARIARRSVGRQPRVMTEVSGVDQQSPLSNKTAVQRGRPPLKKVAEEPEAPSSSSTKTAKRSAERPPKTTSQAVETRPQASPKAIKRTVGRPRKSIGDNVDDVSQGTIRARGHNAQASDQTDLDELDEVLPSSARSARRSVRISDVSAQVGEADELSPEKTREVMGPPPKPSARKNTRNAEVSASKTKETPKKTGLGAWRPRLPKAKPTEVEPVEEPEEPEEAEAEQAEEIDATEAARRLGRKRPRRSIPVALSPADHEEPDDERELPAKRRRGRAPQSPAAQQPPKTRREKKATAAPSHASRQQQQPKQPPTKKRKSKPSAPAGDEDELQGPTNTVPITVQRFTKKAFFPNADNEPDILQSDRIPFAARSGVNAVDVLAQICEELVASYLATLTEQARDAAADAAARRETKTMMRALTLFGEELRGRLLEHTIALDTLHALRKRVRQAQRERVALREEIVRIRREREGVEVRKDAVRVRHEREREEAMANINISSTMHDVDLAVEKGLAAGPLDAKEEGRANLANLEFLIGSVAEQACSKSMQGGTLKQIKDFNAFLERAAAALEGR